MPRQSIKLGIANIPAHTREQVPLRTNYAVLGCILMALAAMPQAGLVTRRTANAVANSPQSSAVLVQTQISSKL